MRQLDLFPALQSSTEGIDTEFKSARGGVANTLGGTIVLSVAEKPTGLMRARMLIATSLSGLCL